MRKKYNTLKIPDNAARPSAKDKLEQVKALGNEEGQTIVRTDLEKETLQEFFHFR